jgi:site-specific DNA recombinase
MNAGLYVRVSTTNQIDRDSLSTQESRLRAYCEANGYGIHEVYIDAGYSAKDTNRPALRKLFRDIEAGRVQAVLVTKLDRITRSLRDLVKLVEFFASHSVKFISITQNVDSSGPFGRFMRDLLALIAQLEREVTAERVSEDMHHRALLGKWNGGIIPYGYTTQQRAAKELVEAGMDEHQAASEATRRFPQPKKLYMDEQEASVVSEIFQSYIDNRSLRKTTHLLNSRGIKTRNGAAWASTSVRRILTNPTYMGKTWYGKRKTNSDTGRLESVSPKEWKISPGEHEAIVSEETFNEAQEILASKARKPTRAHNSYMLAGLLRCGKCGGTLHGYTFTKKNSGKTYIYYKCHNYASKGRSVCTGMTVPSRPLEEFVVQTLMDLSKDRNFLNDKEKMLTTLREECEGASTRRGAEIEKLIAEEKQLQSKLDTLLAKLEDGLIDDEDFSQRYHKIKQTLADNKIMQEQHQQGAERPEAALDALNASFEEIASFGNNWDFLDDEGKRLKIQTVVREIEVFKDKINMQVFLDVDDVYRTDRGSWPPPA